MAGAGHLSRTGTVSRYADQIEPALRNLLDHIAAELAAEYVRLMEVAAQAECSIPHGDSQSNDEEGSPK